MMAAYNPYNRTGTINSMISETESLNFKCHIKLRTTVGSARLQLLTTSACYTNTVTIVTHCSPQDNRPKIYICSSGGAQANKQA